MDLYDMRVRALELSIEYGDFGASVIDTANKFFAFIVNEPAATPREVINAALDKSGVK